MPVIRAVSAHDVRFDLEAGQGADAIHSEPQYAYAVALLHSEKLTGSGLAFTLGAGNELVCRAIELLAEPLAGRDIEELMAGWGAESRRLADHPALRWLGPHKGVVHLALAAISNACFDLWAKTRAVPLWRLLLDLTPEQTVALLDLSYLEDVLTADDALTLLRSWQPSRAQRGGVLEAGYPGYDTSVGWFQYSDEQIRDNARRAVADGFVALKLKVGSPDRNRDVRRAMLVREAAGPDIDIMLDANQQWSLPVAVRTGLELAQIDPYWIEEPTHPDDVLAHQTLARALAPVRVAVGEHIPHRVGFKNFMQAGAAGVVQVDCTRVGGVSEWLAVALLARRWNLPVVPHVGDMGQIHRHLVLWNTVALGHEVLFLEYIPHLREQFVDPAIVGDGVYRTPQSPGSSSDLVRLVNDGSS